MIKKLVKGNNAGTLLVFNLVLFLALLLAPFYATFSWWGVVATCVLYFCFICLGISVTYHRSLTHRSVIFKPWLEKLFVTFACMAGTGSPIMWVMTHRQHHRFADKEGDPHPPKSVWKTFFGVYPRVSTQGIRDIARTRYYAWWHRYYFAILGTYGIVLALLNVNLFVYLFALPIAISISVSNLLNWFGHKKAAISYRNFNLADLSQNNALMGYLVFGEGWHNNHHRYPGSARFGLSPGEFDLSFVVICLLQKLNLANNVKAADSFSRSST
jgi:stearoyl-CoA desaturase (delta-9 desaturase)